jgi:hypothetical protein
LAWPRVLGPHGQRGWLRVILPRGKSFLFLKNLFLFYFYTLPPANPSTFSSLDYQSHMSLSANKVYWRLPLKFITAPLAD